MSKNFELMQEALKEALVETSTTPEPAPVVFVGTEVDRETPRPVSDFDPVAQQECFKLVQRVFLGQAQRFRAVAFAGVDRGNGCSRICIEVARILTANVPGSVCL